jgi:hypothetical protein
LIPFFIRSMVGGRGIVCWLWWLACTAYADDAPSLFSAVSTTAASSIPGVDPNGTSFVNPIFSSTRRRDLMINVPVQVTDVPLANSIELIDRNHLVLGGNQTSNHTGSLNNNSNSSADTNPNTNLLNNLVQMRFQFEPMDVPRVDVVDNLGIGTLNAPMLTTTSSALLSTLFTTLTTSRAAGCVPGTFHSSPLICSVCPPGFYCPGSTSSSSTNAVAIACPKGTANPYPGLLNATACLVCAAGTYTLSAGSMLCLSCTQGFYCAGGTAPPIACPPHTSSPAGSGGLLACECDPNYACSYTRRVNLQLALNTTRSLESLQSDPLLATALRESVLAALGLYGVPNVVATFKGFIAATTA